MLTGLRAIPYLLIAAGLAALIGFGVYYKHLYNQDEVLIDQLNDSLDKAVKANQDAMKALDELKADHARTIAALEKAQADAAKRDEKKNEVIKEIHNAPASDDGPIPPVLGRTLNRLYGSSASH